MRRTRFDWLEGILGVLALILGIATIANPDAMLSTMIRLLAIFAILSAVRDILFYCRTEEYTGLRPMLTLTAGVVGLVAGVMLLCYPNAGKWIVSLLIPIWFISHSIFQLSGLRSLRSITAPWLYALEVGFAAIGFVLGVIMLFHTAWMVAATGLVIGGYLIFTGPEYACSSPLEKAAFKP